MLLAPGGGLHRNTITINAHLCGRKPYGNQRHLHRTRTSPGNVIVFWAGAKCASLPDPAQFSRRAGRAALAPGPSPPLPHRRVWSGSRGMAASGLSTYEAFVALHGAALSASAVPTRYWPSLWHKLENEVGLETEKRWQLRVGTAAF
ncbi:UNVERIFIED_CONTAM: hypothetical protein K2H54_054361 [Gekko kuhli]